MSKRKADEADDAAAPAAPAGAASGGLAAALGVGGNKKSKVGSGSKKKGKGKGSKKGSKAAAAAEAEEDEDEEETDMGLLLRRFSPEELRRYEHFRRSHFEQKAVKLMMKQAAPGNINQKMVIVMGGIAKVFVGEVIEGARAVMKEWGEEADEAICPRHITEAYRRMQRAGKLPYMKTGALRR